MMTSPQTRDVSETLPSRRGHGTQLSISDPSHHVTEAIGTLYGDSDDELSHEPRRENRPLSFVAAPYGGEQIQKRQRPLQHTISPTLLLPPDDSRNTPRVSTPNSPPTIPSSQTSLSVPYSVRTISKQASTDATTSIVGVDDLDGINNTLTLPLNGQQGQRIGSHIDGFIPPLQPTSPLSPTLTLRDAHTGVQSTSQFPLTNIDNPNDIAQELSNLQALRRISMDVSNTADPDFIPFQGMSLMVMPSTAPTGQDDEGDLSRLLWVPAKVHPELAPDQFKSFLEKRVQSIKRRSGGSIPSADGHQQDNVSGGLQRKKSMLSRQVDDRGSDSRGSRDDHDTDDCWKLRRSPSFASTIASAPELSLNELVRDPSKVVQRLTLDTQRQAETGSEPSSLDDDKPILPVPTMGLRRSTRTTYRKGGSLRSGDRLPFSKRVAAARQKDGDQEADETLRPPSSDHPALGHRLQRVQSDPIAAENFSRPVRSTVRRQQTASQDDSSSEVELSNDLSSSQPVANSTPGDHQLTPDSFAAVLKTSPPQRLLSFPRRSSSHHASQAALAPGEPSTESPKSDDQMQQKHQPQKPQSLEQSPQQPPPRSAKRPSGYSVQKPLKPSVSAIDAPYSSNDVLGDGTRNPADHTGALAMRTDSLTFIPTFTTDDRKTDRKTKDKEEGESGKSMGWKWFKSDDKERKRRQREREGDKEKEKEKEREREKERREKDDQTKKSRRGVTERTQLERGHDVTRLDVLQSSIDNATSKGRESLVLDRDNIDTKIHDEKRKDSNRKASESKKEKDGFFGSIFGGTRRKEGRESGGTKNKPRTISPDPPSMLRPDIDYPYTRFPIVEERAIYRMAHIKLANPRRDLQSQVLLSNFMYSYLAKVQAMHPQLNVPTSPHHKRQEEERKRREAEMQQQQQNYEHMMRQQPEQSPSSDIDQYNFEYHRETSQYDDAGHQQNDEAVDYVDDAQIFEYDHANHQNVDLSEHQQNRDEPQDRRDNNQDRTVHDYYNYGHPHGTGRDDGGDDDMW